jgi:hypothetical protein
VRRKWQTAAGAVVVAVAAALGGVSPTVSHSEPAAAAKDSSKPAIVILGYGPDRADAGPTVALGFPANRIILEDKANSTRLLPCAQYEETPSIETNMPWPLTSLVRRVPSKLGKIVHPLNR